MSGFHREQVVFDISRLVDSFLDNYDELISAYKSFLLRGQEHASFIHKQQFDAWPLSKMKQAEVQKRDEENECPGYEI